MYSSSVDISNRGTIMKVLIFLCSFLLAMTAHADTYYIEAISSNKSESILLGHLSKVISLSYIDQGQTITANKEQADWIIEPTLLENEDDQYIINFSKFNNKLKSKKAVFRNNLSAESAADIFTVSQELVAKSIASGSDDIDKINEKKQKESSFYHLSDDGVHNHFYAGLGVAGSDKIDGSDKQGFAWSVGYLKTLNQNLGLKFNLQGVSLFETIGYMGSLSGGLQLYPFKSKYSPYIAALIGISWTNSGDLPSPFCIPNCQDPRISGINQNGFGTDLSIGYQFSRSRRINIAVEVFYSLAFYDIEGSSPETFGGRFVVLFDPSYILPKRKSS